MALIKCAECKKSIASDAEKCPNCGTITDYGKNKKNKIKKRVFLVILLLIIFCTAIFIIFNNKSENNKLIGVWANETIKYETFPISINPYQTKQYKSTTTDLFTFNEDGTCVNESNTLSEYTGNSYGYNSPCKYKVSKNKITITWLDDNYWNIDGESVKTRTMPLFYGENYITFDDVKYEKKH